MIGERGSVMHKMLTRSVALDCNLLSVQLLSP